ncbi:MAG: amino acid/amide transporter substrate-binding protein family [Marmoricola sp.]|nr:amino acid/amide transporter substrate-binding protein family [Marmoricola sp.]
MTPISGPGTKQWLRYALLATSVVVCLTLSACGGSVLKPDFVAAANRAVEGGPSAASTNGPTTPGDPSTGVGGSNPTSPGGSSTSPGGSSTSPGGSSTSPGGSSTSPGGSPGGAAPAVGAGVKAGSCTGFKNQTGVSNSAITIANIADISGPVPGIFTAASYAVQAYAKYFNSTSTICGRKLNVLALDSQTNAGAEQVASQKSCDNAFATVGEMSAFDTGGIATTENCKIPDLQAVITNDARAKCSNCFAAQAPGGGFSPDAIPDYFTAHNKAATQKAAMLYVNAAASVGGALDEVRAEKRRGWKFAYTSSFDIAEFNYSPYVQQMKSKGVKLVQMFGSAQMAIGIAQAMQSADFHPDIYMMNATQYDPAYAAAGSPVEGSIITADFTPIEDMAKVPELALYNQWLQQIKPGAVPTYFGLYAWSAARLFVQQAVALGGKLTRPNMINSIRSVHSWTANGLHAPQDVGGKRVSRCWRFIQLHQGKWVPYGGTGYHCGGVVSAQ